MASSLETSRREQLRFGDPLNRRPMNQMMAKDIKEKQERGYNPNAEKAKARREQERLRRETLQFQKALDHMFKGAILDETDTPEVTNYVLDNIGKYEQVIDTYRTGKGTIVTITFVNLPSPNGIDSKAVR